MKIHMEKKMGEKKIFVRALIVDFTLNICKMCAQRSLGKFITTFSPLCPLT